MSWRRGSSSEEPSPDAGARSELRDNAACPGDRRGAATSVPTPKRRAGWTGVGIGLRRTLTSAAQPEDERVFVPHNATSAARTTGVATGGNPVAIMKREVTFEEAPGSNVQVHRLCRRARGRHRTDDPAGADPLCSSSAVAGEARLQPVSPATGPHTPNRSQSARSSGNRAASSRVGSPAGRPCSPSSGPETTVQRGASTRVPPPSNHSAKE
jgi:hypothetical protein